MSTTKFPDPNFNIPWYATPAERRIIANQQALYELGRQLLSQISTIEQHLTRLGEQMSDETKALIAAFDEATNAVAARIDKLIAAVTAGGSATEAEIRAALQPELDKLKGLGADPAAPIPA